MILSELRSYLNERGCASLSDLVNRFDTDPDTLRGMLALLERKGRVRRMPAKACSTDCSKCDGAGLELYQSIEGAPGKR